MVKRDGDSWSPSLFGGLQQWLGPAAEPAGEAAAITTNAEPQELPDSRAAAFRQRRLLPVATGLDGPRQPGRDHHRPVRDLRGRAARPQGRFEAFVTVSDPKASADARPFKSYLPDMEPHLPIPDELKTKRGSESPSASSTWSTAPARPASPSDDRLQPAQRREGPRREGRQEGPAAQPDRHQVRRHHAPDRRAVLDGEPDPLPRRPGASFYEALFHELSHSLGPAPSRMNGRQARRRARRPRGQLLRARGGQGRRDGRLQRALHDAGEGVPAADGRSLRPPTSPASSGRSVSARSDAHGRGAALQYGYLKEKGAFPGTPSRPSATGSTTPGCRRPARPGAESSCARPRATTPAWSALFNRTPTSTTRPGR